MPGELSSNLASLGLLPLHRASLEGDLDRVVELASDSEKIDVPVLPRAQQPADEPAWPSGETALMLAALMGHLKIFEHLVRKGADYTARDYDDFPLLFYCSDQTFATDKRALYLKHGIGREHSRGRHARDAIIDLLDHPSRLHMMISSVSDSGYPEIFLAKEGPRSKRRFILAICFAFRRATCTRLGLILAYLLTLAS